MKQQLFSIIGILAIGTLCFASNVSALSPDSVRSKHIQEADGTSGQRSNQGSGIKTGHIQDGAVTDAKIRRVSMTKVTGLADALNAIELTPGPQGPQGPAGADGATGPAGLAGPQGPQGVAGADGVNGTNGSNGLNGLACWDLNGNDIPDSGEDVNGDGYVDALDCQGPSNGILALTPYASQPACETTDIGAVALTSLFTTCACNGSDWVSTTDGTTGCEWFEFQTVTSSTGRIWMDRNLGAVRVATSFDDAAASGDLYQWGRGADGHQLRTSATAEVNARSLTDDPGHGDFIPTSGSPADWRETPNELLWEGVSGINNPCPAGFRLPTSTEFIDEINSWSSNDAAGAFDSPLKWPATGDRDMAGNLRPSTTRGSFWVAPYRGGQVNGYVWYNSTTASFNSGAGKTHGMSVRCIQD